MGGFLRDLQVLRYAVLPRLRAARCRPCCADQVVGDRDRTHTALPAADRGGWAAVGPAGYVSAWAAPTSEATRSTPNT